MKYMKFLLKNSPIIFMAISLIFILLSCTGPGVKPTSDVSPSGHKYNVSDNTYTDLTYNVRLAIPNTNWEIQPQNEEWEDAIPLVGLWQDIYMTYISFAVSKHPQASLEEFAKKGVYNAKSAKYTYIAGKRSYFESKPMIKSGLNMITKTYKFVNDNRGYVFGIGFQEKFKEDEQLLSEIEDVLNSLTFLSEGVVAVASETPGGQHTSLEKLTNVALLDIVDLRSGGKSEAAIILTNELQDKLYNTGKFEFIERRNIADIVKEHSFQLTGMVSDESAIEIGNMLGAKYIVSGNLGILQETFVIYIQITDCASGKIIGTASVRCRKCSEDMLFNSIELLSSRIVSGK
jgi:PBP1b-binding outer membrane lipoprotein LpoB